MAGLMNRATERGESTAIVLTCAAGALASLIAGLIAGGSAVAIVVGVLIGLVIGALAGIGLMVLAPRITWTAPSWAGPWPGAAQGSTARRTDLADDDTEALPAAEIDEPIPVTPPPQVLLGTIGHRFRALANRQLAALQDAKRQTNPEMHLATVTRLAARIRRSATSLQVLADHPESHETASACTIEEILRDALVDIEQRARVDHSSLHPASIDGEAVPDLVHLLAELIDNAVTASHAQGSPVVVLGRSSADGYVLSVMDEGLGMAEARRARANDRLQHPTDDWQQDAAFGLATAGRLAARHGIAVTLLEAPTDGVIAKVRLPARLVSGGTLRRSAPGVRPGAPLQDSGTATRSAAAPGATPSPARSAVQAPAEPVTATDKAPSPGSTPTPVGERTPAGSSATATAADHTTSDRSAATLAAGDEPAPARGDPTAPLSLSTDDDPDETSADLDRSLQRARPNPREVTAVRRDPAPPVATKGPEGTGERSSGGVAPRPARNDGRRRGDLKR
jgi:signal transduction histidine kinase